MSTLWITLALVGAVLLVLQLLLSAFGIDGHGHADLEHGHDGPSAALDLVSLRSLSAAAAFGGLAGWALTSAGLPQLLIAPIALIVAAAALYSTAVAVRWLLRFEKDNSIQVADIDGATGTVYLEVPGADAGLGKVHLTVRGQLLELDASTRAGTLTAGQQVMVVAVRRPDLVEVIAAPSDSELLDA